MKKGFNFLRSLSTSIKGCILNMISKLGTEVMDGHLLSALYALSRMRVYELLTVVLPNI